MKTRSSERGAVLIQVAIALVALMAFSAIVIDYGVLWVSRNQAQNAADAGALGAAYHMMTHPTDDPGTIAHGQAVANRNAVWNEAPAAANVLVVPKINCPPGSSGPGQPGCVKVDVYRGATDYNGT